MHTLQRRSTLARLADLKTRSAKNRTGLLALAPLGDESRRSASADIKNAIRDLIFQGELVPGTVLSQVHVAKQLGVSRTPAREALRMLAQEGLVTGEANCRCRVVGFDAEEIDSNYAHRIMIEPLAVAMTARAASADLNRDVSEALASTMTATAHEDYTLWQIGHKAFHRLLISGAPHALRDAVEEKINQTQRYRLLLKSRYPSGWWRRGEIEHAEIELAFRRRDIERLRAAVARHISRSGLEVLIDIAPRYEPTAIRAALDCIDHQWLYPAEAPSRFRNDS